MAFDAFLKRRLAGFLVGGLIVSAGSLSAQVSIDQSKAGKGGVTTGDNAGFPVTISQRGSYKLTSNLRVRTAGVDAIEITKDNVTLDLNGFAIIGPGGGGGFGAGVKTLSNQVTVVNGSVLGMAYGLFVNGTLCRIENVSVAQSTLAGIAVGEGCVVSRSRSQGNGSGFLMFSPALLTGNTAIWNIGAGIAEGSIYNGGGSIVNNVIDGNGGVGLSLNTATGYSQNVLSNNNGGGAQVTGGVSMGGNICSGSLC
jgi:hypothetical protein